MTNADNALKGGGGDNEAASARKSAGVGGTEVRVVLGTCFETKGGTRTTPEERMWWANGGSRWAIGEIESH